MALAVLRRNCYQQLREFLAPVESGDACVMYFVDDRDHPHRLSDGKVRELAYVRDDLLTTDLAGIYMWMHADGAAYKWRLYDATGDTLFWEREASSTFAGQQLTMQRSPVGTIRLAVRIVARDDGLEAQGYFPLSGNTAAAHWFRPDQRLTVVESRFWFESQMMSAGTLGPFQELQLVGDDLQVLRGNVVLNQGTEAANLSLA